MPEYIPQFGTVRTERYKSNLINLLDYNQFNYIVNPQLFFMASRFSSGIGNFRPRPST